MSSGSRFPGSRPSSSGSSRSAPPAIGPSTEKASGSGLLGRAGDVSVANLASWVYLGVSINGAAYTVNAFRPVKNHRVLFVPSFFASWLTIELAWWHLVWQIIATALFAKLGAFKQRPGRVGLVITLVSWGGLILSLKQSFTARREIKEALAELVHDRREPLDLPVKVTRNIVYQQIAGKKIRLDIWQPAEQPAPGERRPGLVQIHGGGWTIGDKREQGRLVLKKLASEGWVGFNVNYRLSPGATFPDHLVDIKRAIAWIRDHAADYGVDPGFLAVTGGSAGGHLAALAALTPGTAELQPGFEDADTSLQAAVPIYGIYDFTNRHGNWYPDAVKTFIEPYVMKAYLDEEPEKFAAASPIDQVNPDAPPFLVIHGDRDTLAPIDDAREFVRVLRESSKEPVYFLELHGAQHAFEVFPSIRARAVVDAVAHFLDGVHHAYLREGGHLEPAAVRKAVTEELDTETLESAIAR